MIVPPLTRGYQKLVLAAILASLLFILYTKTPASSWTRSRISHPGDQDSSIDHFGSQPILSASSQPIVPVEPSEPASLEKEQDISTTGTPEAPLPTGFDNAVTAVDGVIVIGKLETEDTSWVETLSDWTHAVYTVDNTSAPLHTPMNKGREAMPYLTYIVDHYSELPQTLVFLHSHSDGYPGGWHTDSPEHSNIWSVQHLNRDFVQQNGYANLRCIYIPGCPDEIQPFRNDTFTDRASERAMADAWKELFLNDDVPETIGAACCAQFAVSKDQVLKRPLRDYIRFRQWIIDSKHPDDLSGRIIEYLWHIIFGQNPIYCPEIGQCYNDVYGGDQVPPEGYENPEWVTKMIESGSATMV